MSTSDTVLETLKEWVNATNPGFVTREDLVRVESRLDELEELVDELEAVLSERRRTPVQLPSPEESD